jgi:hypothetical protein
MRINFVGRHLSYFVCVLILSACVSLIKFEDMESSLNARIGKPAPDTNSANSNQYRYSDIDSETYELTWVRPDACSYAWVVSKASKTLLKWRYVESPPPTGCKFQAVQQLM